MRVQVGGPLGAAEVTVEIFRPDWSLLPVVEKFRMVIHALKEAEQQIESKLYTEAMVREDLDRVLTELTEQKGRAS